MIDTTVGEIVHGELVTSDASTAQPIILYNKNGAVRTLTAKDMLAITDVRVTTTAATKADLFFDANNNGTVDAGERFWNTDNGTSSGSQLAFHTPIYGPAGAVPKAKAGAAGAFVVIVSGFIVKAA